MRKRSGAVIGIAILHGLMGCVLAAQQGVPQATPYVLQGTVTTVGGEPLEGAAVRVDGLLLRTDKAGHFAVQLAPGARHVSVETARYRSVEIALDMEADRDLRLVLQPSDSITVQATADVLQPDPSSKAYTREDLLDANPGRPGLPLSIPGFPTETASGGIKAPQYFAPGVAGDHGEPIAQYLEVGGSLFQNNLTANAHGNGYADPNLIIPATVGGVLVDNAAFNARYGDHSINVAVTYQLRDRIAPFLSLTSDGRDGEFSAGWGPHDPARREWVALEGMWGNGFLARPEGRQQYKADLYRAWAPGNHELTFLGALYYGFARLPGLIPLDTPVTDDTIDLRQQDLTHTTLGMLADHWSLGTRDALQSSGYFRTYSLGLQSNFGDGLLRQSEFRTVVGGNVTWTRVLTPRWTLLGGVDLRRDAPRGLDLKHADAAGVLQTVTSNDLTIIDAAPFVAVNGTLSRNLGVYAGLRRDEIHFTNRDSINPQNSYTRWPGIESPKMTVTLGRADAAVLPQVGLSFAKAFHANDPRVGSGTGHGALIIQSREYQMVATKLVYGTELRLTLAHQTNSEELAKIDPDTGLQQDIGPSLNRYMTVSARRRYTYGFLQASYSQANAVDLQLHQPLPEAPRLIIDSLATIERLPWHMQGKAEYEYVGEKPLGDGFHGVPVQEIRLNLQKSLDDGVWVIALNGELASGASGQTLETFALPGEAQALERMTGVPLRSYAGASITYRPRLPVSTASVTKAAGASSRIVRSGRSIALGPICSLSGC